MAGGAPISQKNTRRCALIDKDIDDEVGATEAVELSFLQCALERHLDSVAPMPFEKLEQMRNLLSNSHTEDPPKLSTTDTVCNRLNESARPLVDTDPVDTRTTRDTASG